MIVVYALKYIHLIFDTEIISNDRNTNFYPYLPMPDEK